MDMHLATIWESIADAIGDREALVHASTRRTWREFDDRAARLAQAFSEAGLKANSKVGLYLYNSNEYLEVHYGALKGEYIPININYRYLDDELVYLLDNSDSEVLIFHTSLGERVQRVRERAKGVRLWVEVDDGAPSIGAVPYEALVASHDPAPRMKRSEDSLYMLYTGGTTGMPKGVMYRMADVTRTFLELGYPPMLGIEVPPLKDIPAICAKTWNDGAGIVSIPACPLMHGTGLWLGAVVPHLAGGRAVMLPSKSFVAAELWALAEEEKATQLIVVGDAFAKPMLAALEEAKNEARSYDLSSIRMLLSSGVMWTTEVKEKLLEWHPFLIVDIMGSTEGGMGSTITTRENIAQTACFDMNPTTKVFTEDGREVKPGSGEIGMVASGGAVPLGYYKDQAKSDATFKTVNGVRYSFPGDFATIEADGTLKLLGRGSNCINTGGEKVYPEEVEEGIKKHPAVLDCLVLGVDDERFGQKVTGVASLHPDHDISGEALIAFARQTLSPYKLPKNLFIVNQVERAPNGKADYPWALKQVLGMLKAE